jgi:NADH-quinone oxidoreductase subunit H
MMTASAIIATLFLGGYKGPAFLDQWIPGISNWPFIWLILKMAIFMFTFIWMRATLPRLRYDQLMRLGWIYIFEIALASALICGAIIAFVL